MGRIAIAAVMALVAMASASAQGIIGIDLPNAILDKNAELVAVQEELADLCQRAGYANVVVCVDVMANEKHIPMPMQKCVMFAGRAWGCAPGAFAPK